MPHSYRRWAHDVFSAAKSSYLTNSVMTLPGSELMTLQRCIITVLHLYQKKSLLNHWYNYFCLKSKNVMLHIRVFNHTYVHKDPVKTNKAHLFLQCHQINNVFSFITSSSLRDAGHNRKKWQFLKTGF